MPSGRNDVLPWFTSTRSDGAADGQAQVADVMSSSSSVGLRLEASADIPIRRVRPLMKRKATRCNRIP